jgi:hypothetical protein
VTEPHESLPPRALPTAYFAAGHVALVLALLVPALWPERIAGFFLHPRMLAVVHLVTLGWVTMSILGATYIVGPMAMRMPMPARALDWVVFAATVLGAAGVVAHFWMDGYSGVAWSGGLLAAAFAVLAVRVIRALLRAKSPAAPRWHVGLAYGNLLLAAGLGIALAAANKNRPLADVYAHAHLAVVGWATLMVVGAGYRLLPMFLPAAPPGGPLVGASAVLIEAGVLGLALSLWLGGTSAVFAPLVALGIGVFLWNAVRMLRNPRPAPKKLRRPDVGMLHALQALLYLLACAGIGIFLAYAEGPRPALHMVYGVFGLLGFLGQIVVGIGMRLFPMFAWTQAWAASGHASLPPNPHGMPVRALQFAALLLWSAGVPALAFGLWADVHGVVSAGAWLLLAGVLCATANTARVLRVAWRG